MRAGPCLFAISFLFDLKENRVSTTSIDPAYSLGRNNAHLCCCTFIQDESLPIFSERLKFPALIKLRGGEGSSDVIGDDGWAEDVALTSPPSVHRVNQSLCSPAVSKPTAHLSCKNEAPFDDLQAFSIGHDVVAAIAELSIPRMFHGAYGTDDRDILVPDDMPLTQAARAASATRRVLIRRGMELASDRILRIRPRPPPAAASHDDDDGRHRARTDTDVHLGFEGPPRMTHFAGEGPAAGGGGEYGGGEHCSGGGGHGDGGGAPLIQQRMVLLEGCGGSLVHLRLRAQLPEPFETLLEVWTRGWVERTIKMRDKEIL
jgi:hypothetical protein